MIVLHLLIYLVLLIFLASVIARMVRIAKLPLHLRWELYPVPHEKGRAHYGGSFMEEVDWWTKPRHKDHVGEALAMAQEILLLKGLWEHNRGMWFGSWTLHFGLYLLVGQLALALLGGIFTLVDYSGGLLSVLFSAVRFLAWAGSLLGIAGFVAMTLKRLTDPKLKPYNNSSHVFNLLLLGALYVTTLGWVTVNREYGAEVSALHAAWLSFSALPELPTIAYWNVGFTLFFLAYFPFTHMTHAFVKYFTYHDIRWEDAPNVPGSKIEKEMLELESQTVTWAAKHVNADGKKNWVDLAVESGEEKSA